MINNEGRIRNLKEKILVKMLIICQDFVRFCGSQLNFLQWTRLCKSSIFFHQGFCRGGSFRMRKKQTQFIIYTERKYGLLPTGDDGLFGGRQPSPVADESMNI